MTSDAPRSWRASSRRSPLPLPWRWESNTDRAITSDVPSFLRIGHESLPPARHANPFGLPFEFFDGSAFLRPAADLTTNHHPTGEKPMKKSVLAAAVMMLIGTVASADTSSGTLTVTATVESSINLTIE